MQPRRGRGSRRLVGPWLLLIGGGVVASAAQEGVPAPGGSGPESGRQVAIRGAKGAQIGILEDDGRRPTSAAGGPAPRREGQGPAIGDGPAVVPPSRATPPGSGVVSDFPPLPSPTLPDDAGAATATAPGPSRPARAATGDAAVARASVPPGTAPATDAAGESGALLGWSDQLAAQADEFYRIFASTGGDVPEASAILYEAQNLRNAAINLRQGVAAGADPAWSRAAAEQAIAWWNLLATRVQRIAPGHVGPNIQRIMNMGGTCHQIRLCFPDAPATGPGTVAYEGGAVPAGYPVASGVPASPPAGTILVPAPTLRLPVSVPDVLDLLRRLR